MAVGFGFSVGDICASLKIVKESVLALDNTKGAAADYSKLVTEIQSLQDGLEAVQDLQKSKCLSAKQSAALDRAVIDCRKNTQDFLSSISKYQPHLSEDSSGLQSNFRKIKWALCKKDDVAKFREQLARQASRISMLIITFQAREHLGSSATLHGGSTIARLEQTQETNVVEMLSNMSSEQRQCFMIVMKQNEELMRTVQDMRSMMDLQRTIPSQILLQEPVVLLDPFGRLAPFHLEFVDSKECFIAIMKARFAHAGVEPTGLAKVDYQEFSLENTRRRKRVDLTGEWENLWRPGDLYDMKMVFHRFTSQPSPPSSCPSCNMLNDDEEGQIHCHSCGLQYQTVQAISKQSSEWNLHFPENAKVNIGEDEIPYLLRHPSRDVELKVFRPSTESRDKSFEGYRRVQIVSQSLALLDQRYPAFLLIEDFVRFADLVVEFANGVSTYQNDIAQIQHGASHYVSEQQSHLPPFSSFSQIEQRRESLTDVLRSLRQVIDSLVRKLCEDPDTKKLMACIWQNAPRSRITGYYTGVLMKMVSLSEFASTGGTKSPKSISREKMDCLLLDFKPKAKQAPHQNFR